MSVVGLSFLFEGTSAERFKLRQPDGRISVLTLQPGEPYLIAAKSGDVKKCRLKGINKHQVKISEVIEKQQIFTGRLAERTFNPINSKDNTAYPGEIDLKSALSATFTLRWTSEDEASDDTLQLYVYSRDSYFTNLNSDFFNSPTGNSINNILGASAMRATGVSEEPNQLRATIESENFVPQIYLPQIVNVYSSSAIDYQLTVNFLQVTGSPGSPGSNDFLGFWECTSRLRQFSFKIDRRADGSLYLQNYEGDAFNGYTLWTIFAVPLRKSGAGYAYFTGYYQDFSTYYYLNNNNRNSLVSFAGGTANAINAQDIFTIYHRVESPKIRNYQSSTLLYTPTALFESYFNSNFYQLNSQFSGDAQSNDYPGIRKMLEMKDQILQTGIIESFECTDFWPEMTEFGLPTTGASIKTYAPTTVNNAIVQADVFQNSNQLSFVLPKSDYEIDMVVQISGLRGLPSRGVPTEWVNGLFSINFIADLDENNQVIFFSQVPGISTQFFIGVTVWRENTITVTPRSFRLDAPGTNLLLGYRDSDNPDVLLLRGFDGVGGLSEKEINGRYTLYYQEPQEVNGVRKMFVNFLSPTTVAKKTERGQSIGSVRVCNYPFILSFSYLVNSLGAQTYKPCPFSLVFTDKPTLSSSWSSFEIIGLKGEYEHLNGVHDAHPFSSRMFNCRNIPPIWNDRTYPANRRYFTALKLDTLGLPSFDPTIHTQNGRSFQLFKIVARLTDNSNYGDYADACCHLFKNQGVNTHSGCLFYFDAVEGERNPTWDEIRYQIANGVTGNTITTLNRGDFDPIGSTCIYSGISAPPNYNACNLNRSAYKDPGKAIDSAKRLDVSRFEIWSTAPVHRRYLDSTQVFRAYLRISGEVLNKRVPEADPNNENISNYLTSLDYDNNGTLITYETRNLPILFPGSLKLQLLTPRVEEYLMRNSFSNDGFYLRPITGEFILADPPNASFTLLNSAACKGRIVVVIDDNGSINVKYNNCVKAGALAVIICNRFPFLNYFYPRNTIPDGPVDNIMIYAMNNPAADAFTGYNGGNRNLASSYALPRTAATTYSGEFSSYPMIVGPPQFNFSIIRPEFSDGKNIGYLYLPTSSLISPYGIEYNPVFADNYQQDTLVDQFAKLAAAIMMTEFTCADGVVRRFAEMDTIILDNSDNTGGFLEFVTAFASFFGDDRPMLNFKVPTVGSSMGAVSPTNQEIVGRIVADPVRVVTASPNLPCRLYQERYPLAKFTGKKVIILTSTGAYSSGDMLPHFFRNIRVPDAGYIGPKEVDPGKIGNDVTAYLVGTIDGRLQGYGPQNLFYNPLVRTCNFAIAPTVTGETAPIPTYRGYGESGSYSFNSFSGNSTCSQLPEIQINGEPIPCWYEDDGGMYQSLGFSDNYLRDTEKYQRFKDIIGLPRPYQFSTYRFPFLEDAILLASQS